MVIRSVFERAMFEHLDGMPLENADEGKNLAKVVAASKDGVIGWPFPARHHIQCGSPGRWQAGPVPTDRLVRSLGVTWTEAALPLHDSREDQALQKLQDASDGSTQPG